MLQSRKFSGGAITMKGMHLEGRSVYMDSGATTKMDYRVLNAMLPFYTGKYGNPHSRSHMYGWEAEEAVEKSREQVASLINADPKEVIFTSGATESNNIALKGIARFYKKKGQHLITLKTEHKCVINSMRALQMEGFDVTFLDVAEATGLLDLDQLKNAIRKDTTLVSIMLVNNEIGTIQNLKEIGKICSEKGVKLHCDAAQAVGKIPVDVHDLGVDAMSISSHKMYGPKGMGALYVRKRPRLRLNPLISGGGQERGIRPGTLPTPLCVGFGRAAELCSQHMEEDYEHVSKMSKLLFDGLTSQIPKIDINGDIENGYPGILNLSFTGVEGEALIMGMKNISVSSGSACTSASLEPSYVLASLGVSEEMAHTSIRYGISRFSTEKEIDFSIKEGVRVIERLRKLSPLWLMIENGQDLSKINWSSH